jgi:tetratricopeptide (TPR) repeat protein
MSRVRFVEVAKSPEEKAESVDRIARIAREWLDREPQCARAWMHLGCALAAKGEPESAGDAFDSCHAYSDRPEEKAWALFREGGCESDLGRQEAAIRCAVLAAQLTPYIPEPFFLAAFASLKADRPFDALAWADAAIALGSMATVPRVTPTTGAFRLAVAWWEGPWIVRAHALDALGLAELRDHATRMVETARELRGDPMTDAEELVWRTTFDASEADLA